MGWNPFTAAKNLVVGTVSAVGEAAAYTAAAATEVVDVAVNNTVGLIPGVPELNSAELLDSGMRAVGVETELERRAHNIAGIAGAVVGTADPRLDDDGNPLFLTEEGEVTTEDTGIIAPAQKRDHNDQLLYLDADGNETTEVTETPAYQSDGFVNSTVLPWAGSASQYVVGMGTEALDGAVNNTVGRVFDFEVNTSAELDNAFGAMGVETSFEERGQTGWRETGNYAEFWIDDPARAASTLGQGLTDSVTSTVGLAGDVIYGAGHAIVAGAVNSGLGEGDEPMSYVVLDEEGNANFFRMSEGLKEWGQWIEPMEDRLMIGYPVLETDQPVLDVDGNPLVDDAGNVVMVEVPDYDHFIFDADSEIFNPESEFYNAGLAAKHYLNPETNRFEMKPELTENDFLRQTMMQTRVHNPNLRYERLNVAAGQAVGEVATFVAVSIPTGGAGGAALAGLRGTAAAAKNVVTTGRLANATITSVRTASSLNQAARGAQVTNRVTGAIRTASAAVDEAADVVRVTDRALDAAKAADNGVDAAQAVATSSREALERAGRNLDEVLETGGRRLDRTIEGRQHFGWGRRGVEQADLEQHLAKYAENLAQRTSKVEELLEQGVSGPRLQRARDAAENAANRLRREVADVNAVARRVDGVNPISFDDAARLTLTRQEMGLGARVANGWSTGVDRTTRFMMPSSRLEWGIEGSIAAGTTAFLTAQGIAADAEEYDMIDSLSGTDPGAGGGTTEAGLSGQFEQRSAANGSLTTTGEVIDGSGATTIEFGNRSNGLVTPTGGPVFEINVSPEAAQKLQGALDR